MKILHPDVSRELIKIANITSLLTSEDKINGYEIRDINISSSRLKGVVFEDSLISKTNFANTNIEKFEVKDCIFRDCDFTASSLVDSSWHVAEIIGARCSGLQLQNSTLRNILFKGCKLELVNFRFSKLENIIFEDCVINDIDFYSASLKNVTFLGSNIENISFSNARLKNVDLTESQIISTKGVSGLRGATINYEQLIFLAPYLAQEIGVILKND